VTRALVNTQRTEGQVYNVCLGIRVQGHVVRTSHPCITEKRAGFLLRGPQLDPTTSFFVFSKRSNTNKMGEYFGSDRLNDIQRSLKRAFKCLASGDELQDFLRVSEFPYN
jgi:hypothetical protein